MQGEQYSLRMQVEPVTDVGQDGFQRTQERRTYSITGISVAELPEGVDAVFVVRSDVDRSHMHSMLVSICNDAFIRSWPPSDPNGGDKAHLRK